MDVNIILCGRPRFNEKTIQSFNQHIIKPIQKKHNVEIFASTDKQYFEQWSALKFDCYFNILETQNIPFESTMFSKHWHPKSDIFYQQYRHLYHVSRNVRPECDIVFKTRLDFIYENEFDVKNFENIEDKIYVASKEHHWHLDFDPQKVCAEQVYFGKRDIVLRTIDMVVDQTINYTGTNTFEEYLKRYLDTVGIPYVQFFNFHYTKDAHD